MRFKLQAASNKRQVCKSAHPLEWCIFLLKGKSFSYRVLYITNRRRKYEVDVERVKQVRDSIWKAWEEVRTMRGKKKTLPIFGVEMFLMELGRQQME
jgi:hypothetical protein